MKVKKTEPDGELLDMFRAVVVIEINMKYFPQCLSCVR